MGSLQDKGRALERAVEAIERTILRSFEALKESAFTVQARKVLSAGGVRHEIDIWVQVNLARGYGSVFIFECKNWNDKVGKNEVIVLSEKIDAAHAQRGFLVAKAFTQDAEAQAAKDPRLELVLAADVPPEMVAPLQFHILGINDTHVTITFNHAGVDEAGARYTKIDLATATAIVSGKPVDLTEYLKVEIGRIRDSRTNTFQSDQMPDGVYNLEAEGAVEYDPEQFIVDGHGIERVRIKVEFEAHVVHPTIEACLDVQGRGRAILLGNASVPGAEFTEMVVSSANSDDDQ
jgi:hypothetical protein